MSQRRCHCCVEAPKGLPATIHWWAVGERWWQCSLGVLASDDEGRLKVNKGMLADRHAGSRWQITRRESAVRARYFSDLDSCLRMQDDVALMRDLYRPSMDDVCFRPSRLQDSVELSWQPSQPCIGIWRLARLPRFDLHQEATFIQRRSVCYKLFCVVRRCSIISYALGNPYIK